MTKENDMGKDTQPIKNIKVSRNAYISMDEHGFTIELRHYDTASLFINGNLGAHGDWTIDDLLVAATRVQTIANALRPEAAHE